MLGHLTVKLRGRAEAPALGAKGAQFLSARGANQKALHGPLQRLLDAMRTYSSRSPRFGNKGRRSSPGRMRLTTMPHTNMRAMTSPYPASHLRALSGRRGMIQIAAPIITTRVSAENT